MAKQPDPRPFKLEVQDGWREVATFATEEEAEEARRSAEISTAVAPVRVRKAD